MRMRLVIHCHFIVAVFSVALSVNGFVKQLHKGLDDVINGNIKGATEVTGTPVDVKDVHFFLETSQTRNLNETVDPFHPERVAETGDKIFFFIHGWTQSRASCPWYKPLSNVLLEKYPTSHIVEVDWGKPAADNYAYAAFNTESVGKIVAAVIQKLIHLYGVPRERIIPIGHSLGGQILGWIGKEYQKLTNESLSRLIALDPAGVIFDVRPDSRRLNKHDAEVVMVVHTDTKKFGFPKDCGSIDFYPNNGANQPGCMQMNLTDLSFSALTEPIWCSHRRAHDLFIEAIKFPQSFIATKCENYDDYKNKKCEQNERASMGNLETKKIGSFYLDTSGKPPFILNSTIPE